MMSERKPRLLNGQKLWEYALRVLAGRASSTGEIREKLRRRAERASDVDDALARLKDYGYLNDRRFAEGFAAARLSNEKLGRARVLRDLRQRRVAPALAESTVLPATSLPSAVARATSTSGVSEASARYPSAANPSRTTTAIPPRMKRRDQAGGSPPPSRSE